MHPLATAARRGHPRATARVRGVQTGHDVEVVEARSVQREDERAQRDEQTAQQHQLLPLHVHRALKLGRWLRLSQTTQIFWYILHY